MKHKIVYRHISVTSALISALFMSILLYSEQTQHTSPDIHHPGPDNANFTASPFTLPKGRCYVETFPLWTQITECPIGKTYHCSYLIRVGLTDYIELRLLGNGLTHIENNSSHATTGFSPFNAGFKIHLWGKQEMHWIPSVGFEAYIVTPLASKDLKEGTQFACTSMFDLRCSNGLLLEWNIGAYTQSVQPCKNKRDLYFLLEWSLQQDITHSLSLFFEGAYRSALYPKITEMLLFGAGFISYITNTVAIFGSYNWSALHKTQGELANFGFALAF
jgi:hypothetical protein